MPNDTPQVVSETAREIQNRYDTSTPYNKARAIERYLVYDGGFTYNLDADFRRADRAVEKFLDKKWPQGRILYSVRDFHGPDLPRPRRAFEGRLRFHAR